MRIAHLPASFLPVIGGAEIAVHNIAFQQVCNGHEVTVLAPYPSWKRLAGKLPYKILPLLPRSFWLVKKLWDRGIDGRFLWEQQIDILQKKYRFDVWHFTMITYRAFFSLRRLRRMGVATVGTCQGADIQLMPEIGYGARLDTKHDTAIRNALSSFDLVTAISPSIRREYENIGVHSNRIRDIPNGVELERILRFPASRAHTRVMHNLPVDRKLILTVGRNHPKKGYSFIPEILREIVRERKDILWVIVGRETEPIGKKARELGVGEYLRLIPELGVKDASLDARPVVPSDNLISLYKAADVFAFPTLLEGCALVLVEAMASELPVVSTDAPGCLDIVTHRRTGLVSRVANSGQMAKNILQVLYDNDLRATISREALRVVEAYSWRRITESYCSAYQEAMNYRYKL